MQYVMCSLKTFLKKESLSFLHWLKNYLEFWCWISKYLNIFQIIYYEPNPMMARKYTLHDLNLVKLIATCLIGLHRNYYGESSTRTWKCVPVTQTGPQCCSLSISTQSCCCLVVLSIASREVLWYLVIIHFMSKENVYSVNLPHFQLHIAHAD